MIQNRKPMRIGIFGGSFNPIHNGHLHAVQAFSKRFKLDAVLLVPAAVSFYKETDRTAFEHRYKMCRLATDSLSESIIVSDLERSSPEGMCTYDLIRAVAGQYADSDIFLFIGNDIYHRLPIWQEVDEILASCVICVLKRNVDEDETLSGQTTSELKSRDGKVIFVEDPMLSVSSTQIRERVAAGRSISDLVPKAVENYIGKNELYSFRFSDAETS